MVDRIVSFAMEMEITRFPARISAAVGGLVTAHVGTANADGRSSIKKAKASALAVRTILFLVEHIHVL
jgi:hypothetical protein